MTEEAADAVADEAEDAGQEHDQKTDVHLSLVPRLVLGGARCADAAARSLRRDRSLQLATLVLLVCALEVVASQLSLDGAASHGWGMGRPQLRGAAVEGGPASGAVPAHVILEVAANEHGGGEARGRQRLRGAASTVVAVSKPGDPLAGAAPGSDAPWVTRGRRCAHSAGGREWAVDDRGAVCGRRVLDPDSGCCPAPPMTDRGGRPSAPGAATCPACDPRSRCCGTLEHCAACCMARNATDPSQLPSPRAPLRGAARLAGAPPVPAPTLPPLPRCLAACRTRSSSVHQENSYRARSHFCYGSWPPPVELRPVNSVVERALGAGSG